jgi:hypothetical protein
MKSQSRVHRFFAYHGTDENSAKNIIDNGFKIPALIRDDHWLGNGLYFYREDEEQALIWAIFKIRNRPELEGLKAIVIESKIKVSEENFLNLDSRKHIDFFADFIKEACATAENNNVQIVFSDEEDDKVRNFFFNLLPENYYVIQRTFPVKSKYDKNKMFKRMCLYLQGVQICVRNLSVLDGPPKVILEREVKVFKVKRKHARNQEFKFDL